MNYVESKRFIFSHPPTGVDVVDLISDYDLHGWRMNINRELNESVNGLAQMSRYRWEVIFERTKDK